MLNLRDSGDDFISKERDAKMKKWQTKKELDKAIEVSHACTLPYVKVLTHLLTHF